MHCHNNTSSSTSDSTAVTEHIVKAGTEISNKRPHYAQRPPSVLDSTAPPLRESSGEAESDTILAWESCGRVVSTERADFFEFIAVNLLFSCLGAGVVIWRSRRMRLLHARQLAARIGMVGRRR
ncbi:hypothetical protein AN958_11123 [Leucoagaricus sp. SymC.cos]|nr:hypothetical protein AN958_11121 [Leucoagaricus sp. SymC.cos]KXN85556.1 hypothetical protein AN958_11123 [Leucoagaricus sp. SymC.cos]